MKIVIAIDSFKGSLTSLEAGEAAKEGILRVYSDAEVIIRPVADGGEGTVTTLVQGLDGHMIDIEVTGPIGNPVHSQYGILNDNRTAVIEMAAAAGLPLIAEKDRNPMNTTTYGVGEIIADAIKRGCQDFIIGIGGSATNDGGTGMLQALGYEFYDSNSRPIQPGAKGLEYLTSIDDHNVLPELKNCKFNIACDVTNVLCGDSGCSAVFGPQKGATPDMIIQMDHWLSNYARICRSKYSDADQYYPGTGAAGGLGYAFLTFMQANLTSGVDLVLSKTNLEDYVRNADIVVTGEGCLDEQTSMGKAPAGVALIAKKHNRPVIAFAGCVNPNAVKSNSTGIDAFFPILRNITTLDAALDKDTAYNNLAATSEQVFRLIRTIRS